MSNQPNVYIVVCIDFDCLTSGLCYILFGSGVYFEKLNGSLVTTLACMYVYTLITVGCLHC